jgi:hypothetical protein
LFSNGYWVLVRQVSSTDSTSFSDFLFSFWWWSRLSERSSQELPSARLTLHSTKVCPWFRIFREKKISWY